LAVCRFGNVGHLYPACEITATSAKRGRACKRVHCDNSKKSMNDGLSA
jgi:hypothetical protein